MKLILLILCFVPIVSVLSDCDPGYFHNDVTNACQQWTTCNAGFFNLGYSNTSDGTCTPCPNGEYKTQNSSCSICIHDIGRCTAHPTCPAGEGRTNALSTTEPVTCGTCPAGEFSAVDSTNACDVCPAGSVTDTLANTGAISCTACGAEEFSTDSTVACQPWTPCDAEFYKDGASSSSDGQCTACTGGHTCAGGLDAPVPCPAGEFLVAGSAASIEVTHTGTPAYPGDSNYVSQAECEAFATSLGVTFTLLSSIYDLSSTIYPGCFQHGDNALGNPIYYYTPDSSDAFLSSCNPDDVRTVFFCITKSPSTATTCEACPAGSVTDTLANTGGASCTECGAGEFSTDPTVACQSWTTCDAGDFKEGHTSSSDGQCSPCPTGHKCAGGLEVPVACGNDEYQPDVQQSTCIPCEDGYESLSSGGQFTNSGATQCVLCNSATHYDHDGHAHTECLTTNSSCNSGFYFTETDVTQPNTCTPCSTNSYKVGSNTQSSCSPHPTCPVGQGRTNAIVTTESVTCAPCPMGEFSSLDNLDECQPWTTCNAGDFKEGHTSSSDGQCTPCPAGYTCAGGLNDKVVCAAGSVTNTLTNTGATSCNTCNAGLFSSDSTIACEVCPAGSVTNTLTNTGATSCTSCDAGHFSTVSTEACQLWTTCDAGDFKEGHSLSSDGQCTICPAGYKCAGGLNDKVPCPPDEASTAGQSTCTPCDDESTGNKVVVTRNTQTGDFSVSSTECQTIADTNSFTQGTYNDKPSGCVKDSFNAYFYNNFDTSIQCSDNILCIGHVATEASIQCNVCPEGTWKEENTNVCHRWTYLVDHCPPGMVYVHGSTESNSFCETNSFQYTKNEPSDSTLDLSSASASCGAQYALVNQVGNIVCTDCDLDQFKRVYSGSIHTTNNAMKRGSCCKNSHHHVCIQMKNEFDLKCGTCEV